MGLLGFFNSSVSIVEPNSDVQFYTDSVCIHVSYEALTRRTLSLELPLLKNENHHELLSSFVDHFSSDAFYTNLVK